MLDKQIAFEQATLRRLLEKERRPARLPPPPIGAPIFRGITGAPQPQLVTAPPTPVAAYSTPALVVEGAPGAPGAPRGPLTEGIDEAGGSPRPPKREVEDEVPLGPPMLSQGGGEGPPPSFPSGVSEDTRINPGRSREEAYKEEKETGGTGGETGEAARKETDRGGVQQDSIHHTARQQQQGTIPAAAVETLKQAQPDGAATAEVPAAAAAAAADTTMPWYKTVAGIGLILISTALLLLFCFRCYMKRREQGVGGPLGGGPPNSTLGAPGQGVQQQQQGIKEENKGKRPSSAAYSHLSDQHNVRDPENGHWWDQEEEEETNAFGPS
ncbi:acetyltransferase domain-containing protein, putative [Eimeria maxima]|uniref:Acetyltransferase domain-containing protein, putative n=1 Tax=Eimeria maxima TaxID=5804 RepID=U6M664_EIMMA|nr:acetyltransferase domain-containing protein, putative [Eimeria maxima]CDJ58533.1 acetyltransferase domain-containing protein, putative [Eimeria maxima]